MTSPPSPLSHLEALLASNSNSGNESFPLPFRLEHVGHMHHDLYDADGEHIASISFRLPSEIIVAAVNSLPALIRIAKAAEALSRAVMPVRGNHIGDLVFELRRALSALKETP